MNPSRIRSRRPQGIVALALLVLMAGRARADLTQITVGFDTHVPIARISYSASDRSDHPRRNSTGAYIGPFSVNSGGATPATMFCIDLWHDMSGGDSFKGTVSPATDVASQKGWFPDSNSTLRSPDSLTSKLNYLGSVYLTLASQLKGSALTDAMGAVQLGIWYLIDKNFAVSHVRHDPHHNLLTDFGSIKDGTGGIVGLLSGTSETIEGQKITGWSSTAIYSAGTLVRVDRGIDDQSRRYQNMIGWSAPTFHGQSVPEPSTFALAGVGAMAFIGHAFRRRRRA